MTGREDGSRRAWSDVLATGDTRTWRAFRTAVPGAVADPSRAASAGQLEVVRRLALAHPGLPGFPRLAELVIGTPAAGRGPVDIPCADDDAHHGWGTPAVEPDALPPGELLRIAVPVLAALLPPATEAPGAAPTPWRAPRFVVHGAPGVAAAVAEALTAAGWVHGPFRATHLVLACPLDDAVEQWWADRTAHGAVRSWRRTWRTVQGRDVVPTPLDPAALAEKVAAGLTSRQRQRRLHVVVGPDARSTLSSTLALLGVPPSAGPRPVDPPGTDLRRRLNVLTSGRTPLDARLLDMVAPQHVVPLGVPAPSRDWAQARATRITAAVEGLRRAADYPVHGDPDVLGTLRGGTATTRVDPGETFERALAAIAAAWQARSMREG